MINRLPPEYYETAIEQTRQRIAEIKHSTLPANIAANKVARLETRIIRFNSVLDRIARQEIANEVYCDVCSMPDCNDCIQESE